MRFWYWNTTKFCQCRQDIKALCGETVPGEGRIAACLLDNKSKLTPHCSGAIDQVGLKKN